MSFYETTVLQMFWFVCIGLLASIAGEDTVACDKDIPVSAKCFGLNSLSKTNSMASQWVENSLTDVECAPKTQASVTFGSLALESIGQVLTPTDVKEQPKVKWPAEDGKLYTVLMLDPDAPSRENPKFGQWFHWGVINIQGNDIDKGEVIAEYVGAGPPKSTGLHRYVILVYKQTGRVDYTDKKLVMSSDNRPSKSAKDIASKYNLGKPIAGACFQAEYDEYVPILYSKLK